MGKTLRFLSLPLTVLLLLNVGACGGDPELPALGSQAYEEVVSSFYTGVAALQVGENQLAENLLVDVTEQVPQEPAAWINLALLALRRQAFDVAAERLEEARALAPENSHIQYLMGLLYRNQGRFEEAAAHLRRALALDPGNVKAAYAMAEVIGRQGGPQGAARVQELLRGILAVDPDNLPVLLERARLAAGQGQADTLRAVLAHVTAYAEGARAEAWPAEAREQLQAARAAAAGPDVSTAATHIAFLKNVLKRVPAYREDLAALQTPAGQVGEVVTHFLRLPTPRFTPAPPDTALRFSPEPLFAGADSGKAWARALPLTRRRNALTTAWLPSVVVAGGGRVQVDTSAVLPFPGASSSRSSTAHGLAALDYNYDFKRDLALAGPGGFRLYRQDESGAFEDVTARLGLSPSVTDAAYAGVWAADLDMEGDVDLVLARAQGPPRVLRNTGDGSFSTWDLFEDVANLRAFAWADLDADGDPDAALIDESRQLYVFVNRRGGRFQARPQPVEGALALDVADVNRDAVLDLLVLQADGAVRRLSYGAGGDTTVVLTRSPGLPENLAVGEAGLFAADLDNNGGQDLIAATPAGTRIWLNDRQGAFQPLGDALDARVFSVSDLGGEGRLELVGLSESGRPVRLVSQGATQYLATTIRPRAARIRGDRRVNPFGVGGEIEIRAGAMYQKKLITDPIVHFGLGLHAEVDVARIIWPNGTVQAEFDLRSDQAVLTRQRLKGSCPWVFTYDGEGMQFATDFLWRTALGLRINAQGPALVIHSVDWIKISGDALVPRPEGFYDVRITGELWETHFFDHVALLVVDHPADTRIFVDERFVLPPPEPAVHPTGPLHPFSGAWTSEGTEVTEVVRARDGRYLDAFALGPYQGLAEEHYVEVELGDDAPRRGPLWLVASGWVYPTDSSINVALGQGTREPPHGLSLEVPDGEGGWTVAKAGLGFPAGKKKTILIDLSDVFRPGAPCRLRLRTNMEIYWDRLAWAAGRPEVNIKTQRILPETARLRYRGFSVTRKPRRSSPLVPVYDEITATTPQWRDLVGYYTRFGPVRELVEEVDDRYVIMNAGDELVLRFPAPPPPSDTSGWTRDFVLIGDGWVKDGDYNTGLSKTVRPLPYHGLTDYSTPPGPLEEDPAYRRHPEDWRTYHTRYVSPHHFQHALGVR